jgi:hypothetical protein
MAAVTHRNSISARAKRLRERTQQLELPDAEVARRSGLSERR